MTKPAEITTTKANNFIAINLPIKTFILEGWRTNKLRNVPYVYSCAVCAAKIHKATIPNNPAALLKLNDKPVGNSRVSREMRIPSRPFPSGESTNKKSSEVDNPVINKTAAKVERDSDARFNLTNSARTTFNIIDHQSFQRMYPLKMLGLVLKMTE